MFYILNDNLERGVYRKVAQVNSSLINKTMKKHTFRHVFYLCIILGILIFSSENWIPEDRNLDLKNSQG